MSAGPREHPGHRACCKGTTKPLPWAVYTSAAARAIIIKEERATVDCAFLQYFSPKQDEGQKHHVEALEETKLVNSKGSHHL